jgi:Rho termination factor, N-terminal domain
MPTTQPDNAPQSSFLNAVRESQAAVLDVVRAWTDIGQQLTRDLRLPVARIDLADAVDRVFDVAEQTLAAQRELARTLAGAAARQVDITVDTVVEAADTTVETVEGTVRESARRAEAEEPRPSQDRVGQPQAGRGDAAKTEAPRQDRRPDGRTYEERSVEELRERAGVLQIEGRSAMNKEELIAALRSHRRARSARTDAPRSQPPTQDRPADRRTYEDRSVEELRERARELEIEGRSTMSKDELIAALREQAR